jgi:hypothetical protein
MIDKTTKKLRKEIVELSNLLDVASLHDDADPSDTRDRDMTVVGTIFNMIRLVMRVQS